MYKFVTALVVSILFTVNAFGQCSSAGCSSASGGSGLGIFRGQMFYMAPQSGSCANGSCSANAAYEPPQLIDGVLHEKYTDGFWRPASAATIAAVSAPKPGDCGCAACSLVTKTVSLPSMINPKTLTEVKPDPDYALYQDSAGSLYYLRRDAVASAKGLVPAGKFVWTSTK